MRTSAWAIVFLCCDRPTRGLGRQNCVDDDRGRPINYKRDDGGASRANRKCRTDVGPVGAAIWVPIARASLLQLYISTAKRLAHQAAPGGVQRAIASLAMAAQQIRALLQQTHQKLVNTKPRPPVTAHDLLKASLLR